MGLNRKHTKEEIENLRLKAKGNKHALGLRWSEEQKQKIKGRYKGKKLPESTKAKMRLAQKGNKKFLGKKHSEKTKQIMCLNNLGEKNPAWL